MSADDEKRRRSKRLKQPPEKDPAPAGGGFFAAPTRAFHALPTEVLDVGSVPGRLPTAARGVRREGPSNALSDDDVSDDDVSAELSADLSAEHSDDSFPREDLRSNARTRATRLPPSLLGSYDERGDFADSPPTEGIDAAEVRRLSARHAPFPEHETEHFDLTNPDPFRVDLDSDERALFEVAREPTHHDLFLDPGGGPPSETSTDVESPKPISGLHPFEPSLSAGGFEDRTVALEAVDAPAHVRSPLFEATDEDAALPSEPDSLELPPPVPPPVPDDDEHAQDRYYAELREVIGAARVYDPKRPAHLVTDPGYRDRSEDWPEITLPPAPLPPAARRGLPIGLIAFLASVLIVTVGGVGIGFALSKRGVSLDDLIAAWGLVEAPHDDEVAAPDEETALGPAPESETGVQEASEASAAVDDARWKTRTVQVHLAKVSDASRSKSPELAKTLENAFASALQSDERARWRIAASKPRRGFGFALALQIVSVDLRSDGSARVSCALEGSRHHEPRGVVSASVNAERRADGSLKGADDDKLAREAARACGFALALDFIPRAVAD